jgi:hypothetical protein
MLASARYRSRFCNHPEKHPMDVLHFQVESTIYHFKIDVAAPKAVFSLKWKMKNFK